jgi:RNA polymerase sigma-70 factor (ECF subfamily)
VLRTALNTHVSWWRRRRRETPVEGRTALILLDGTQPERSADLDLDEVLAAAVRALPLRQREVITLRVFCDLDTDATAKLLGISAGTVGAHLHRALVTLRAQTQSFSDQEVTR